MNSIINSPILELYRIPLALLGFYISMIIIHQAILAYYYLLKGRFGTRIILHKDRIAFHYNLVEDVKGPLVIFESHLGYGSACWGYFQEKLRHKLPTLAYHRCGYGWSKELEYIAPRTAEEMAMELKLLLEELRFDKHPIILVGHSFGGTIMQTYLHKYPSKYNIGLVLLDTLPLEYMDLYSQIREFTCERLPKSLKTASSFADLGLFRFTWYTFGLSSVQVTKLMREKLSKDQINSILAISFDGRTLKTMSVEMQGYNQSLETLNKLLEDYKGTTETVVVTTKNVELPAVDVGMDTEKWTANWHKAQKDILSKYNQISEIVIDSCHHNDLCVSDKVLEIIERTFYDKKKYD